MTRSRSIAIALVAILAVGAGGYLAYDNVLQGDNLAPLALPSASAAAVDPTDGPGRQREPRPPAPTRRPPPARMPAATPSPARGRPRPAAWPATASASSSPTCRPSPTPSVARAT